MNWFDLVFSFSDIGILFNLWMCWLLWALMFLPPKILTVDRLHMGGLGLALPQYCSSLKESPHPHCTMSRPTLYKCVATVLQGLLCTLDGITVPVFYGKRSPVVRLISRYSGKTIHWKLKPTRKCMRVEHRFVSRHKLLCPSYCLPSCSVVVLSGSCDGTASDWLED